MGRYSNLGKDKFTTGAAACFEMHPTGEFKTINEGVVITNISDIETAQFMTKLSGYFRRSKIWCFAVGASEYDNVILIENVTMRGMRIFIQEELFGGGGIDTGQE